MKCLLTTIFCTIAFGSTIAQAESTHEAIPEISVGESVVIDDIKITVNNVRMGYIEKKSLFGGSTTKSEPKYLIAELTLENTSPGRIIILQDTWEKTRIVDDFDNNQSAIYSSSLMNYTIVGSVSFAEMKPGDIIQDMCIFDLPVEAATQFKIVSNPGIWKSVPENRLHEISDKTFSVKFTREQLTK